MARVTMRGSGRCVKGARRCRLLKAAGTSVTPVLPLVLIDVDGVLNALSETGAWADLRTGEAVAQGRSYPIRWSPMVVERVVSWCGIADVQWLTTWGHDANSSLRHLVWLPELPVAGTHDGAAAAGSLDAGAAHAAVTPAAPDALTGQWWKFDVVRRLVREDPSRPMVWLDDDLVNQHEICSWMGSSAMALVLAPDGASGLVVADLDAVDAYLWRELIG